MRETPTHKPDIPADCPGVRLYGICTLSTQMLLTGTDRLGLHATVLHHSETAV